MPDLYSMVYLSPSFAQRRRPQNLTACGEAFYKAVSLADPFPYDIGDDPAFFSACYHGGPITWGVCRPDVRANVRPGDWVVFFAGVERPNERGSKGRSYQLAAFLRVAAKISHTKVFLEPGRNLGGYLNLLVRPDGIGWEHYEPCLSNRDWHADWMWRIARQRGLRKNYVTEKNGVPLKAEIYLPLMERLPDNYVIFDPGVGRLLRMPIPVATYHPGDERETWYADFRSQRIKSAVFQDSARCLRTTNRQQPHRHFRREITDDWTSIMQDAIN
ncbi:MAG: hypothetical protein ABIK36_06870 [Pseudomonadota bacterium]